MSGLVPEKRADKNGRVVTRHVRQGTAASRKLPSVPTLPPGVQQPEEPSRTVPPRRTKLRASQRQQRRIVVREGMSPWVSNAFRDAWDKFTLDVTFTASEAEAYAVASVCENPGDAAKLLSMGKRSADEAREHMESHGLATLLADRSEIVDEALAKGVRFEDFLRCHSVLWENRPVENRIGALRFDASSLSSSYVLHGVRQQILNGEIDFDDIKAIGIGRLKPDDRLRHFAPLLRKAHSGEDGFDVETIRALAVRIDEDEPIEFSHVVALASVIGPASILDLPSLRAAAHVHRSMEANNELHDRDAAEKALYAARFMAAAGRQMGLAREYYEAGIPLEMAIEVHKNGGSVQQATAIRDEGIAASLSDGYL